MITKKRKHNIDKKNGIAKLFICVFKDVLILAKTSELGIKMFEKFLEIAKSFSSPS